MTAEHTIAADLGAGYRRLPRPLHEAHIAGDFVVVREHLDRQADISTGFVLLRSQNTTLGTVLAAGPDAREAGITPGDAVAYEEWQGGRWCFPDPDADGGEVRCLIMRVEHVLLRIPNDESS